jgi:hypothetical protein
VLTCAPLLRNLDMKKALSHSGNPGSRALWSLGVSDLKRAVLIGISLILPFAAGAQTQPGATAANPAVLQGSDPVLFNDLPPLPPDGFSAWCRTDRGSCVVRAKVPIAPGSACHCGQYPGRTV